MRQTYADRITDRHIQPTDDVSLTTYFLLIADNMKMIKYCSTWCHVKVLELLDLNSAYMYVKVAYTSGPIFEKIMKRYPILSVQIINYQMDQKHK